MSPERRPYVPAPEWIAETTRRSRAEQGLPPTIEDPDTLEKAAYGP
ncbi:hypothetical protein Lfu02_57910 [Longispora fulva]|nr:hypothetical protein Lfu02_57910 [Longispora fulva]